MRITLNTLTAVTRIVIVVCTNRWGLHDGIYIRYCILVGSHEDALWLDDPTDLEVIALVKRSSSDVKQEAFQAPCPFCSAHEMWGNKGGGKS